MPSGRDKKVRIVSTGIYLPRNIYTNEQVVERIRKAVGDPLDPRLKGFSARQIESNTGIRNRRYADMVAEEDPETAVNMSFHALVGALAQAGWKALDLDFIIFATVSVGNNPGDHLIPSAACHLQQLAGAYNAMAYDLKAACSGWVYAMSQAIANIEAGLAERGAVICTETQERGLDFTDPASCVLIGDIGTATLVERSRQADVLFLSTEANSRRHLKEALRLNDANVYGDRGALGRPVFRLKGPTVYKEGIRHMSRLLGESLEGAGLEVGEVDHFIFHQANGAMLKRVARMNGIPEDRNLMNIAEVANTTSGTIPSVLHMFRQDGTIRKGQTVVFVAFGGGITAGSLVMRI